MSHCLFNPQVAVRSGQAEPCVPAGILTCTSTGSRKYFHFLCKLDGENWRTEHCPHDRSSAQKRVCILYLTQGSSSDEDSGLVIHGGVPDSPVSNMPLMLLVPGLGLRVRFSGVSILQNPRPPPRELVERLGPAFDL